MKYKFLVSLLLAANLNAQYIIDSGNFSNLPTLRSANIFGENIVLAFDNNRPENKYGKILSYGIEYGLSIQYFTSIHELGHANVAKYYNCDIAISGSKNWWQTAFTHKICPDTFYYGKLDEIKFQIAGFNATTNLVEQNFRSNNLIFDNLGRLSSLTYILFGSKSHSDFNALNKLDYGVSKYKFLAAQIATYALSLGKIQFYSYLNSDGLSIRARNYNYKGFDVALESLISGKYNCEVAISKSINVNSFKVKPEIVTSLHGIGYNISVEYRNLVMGYRNPNLGTLSGARELSREFYAQVKF